VNGVPRHRSGAGDGNRTRTVSLEGRALWVGFALLRACLGSRRAFRLPERRAHGGGESGISFLSDGSVAQRRGGGGGQAGLRPTVMAGLPIGVDAVVTAFSPASTSACCALASSRAVPP
jgi:hypothetical protein